MMGRTHMMFGALFGVATCLVTKEQDPVMAFSGVTCAVVGSLLPDIDHPNSKISRSNWAIGELSRLVSAPEWGSHRRFWHTIPASILFAGIFYVLMQIADTMVLNVIGNLTGVNISIGGYILPLTVYLFIGSISHIFADWLNVEGSPIISPPPFKKKQHIPLIACHTGSIAEHFWKIGVSGVALFLFYVYAREYLGMPDITPMVERVLG